MPTQRNTLQRELVLQAVCQLHNHPTAEEIYARLARKHPSISRATVYRNLSVLVQQGKVRRVSHLDAADRFDHTLRPHYHFYCRQCGCVFDTDLPYQSDLLSAIPNRDGHQIDEVEITLSGICSGCKANA